MEFIIGLVSGVLLNYYAFGVFFLLAIMWENNDSHILAGLTGITSIIIGYNLLNIDRQYMALYIASYFIIGFVWSLYRYYKFLDAKMSKHNGVTQSYWKAEHQIDNIVGWCINWPFSACVYLTSDMFDLTKAIIKTFSGKLYQKIYDSVMNKYKKD